MGSKEFSGFVVGGHESPIKRFCWSCGKSPGNCLCKKGPQVVEVRKPNLEYLPQVFCRGENSTNIVPSETGQITLRPCCVCGGKWECSYDEWVNGVCPHCGASGNQNAYSETVKMMPKENGNIRNVKKQLTAILASPVLSYEIKKS